MIRFIRNVLGQTSGALSSALFNLEGTNYRRFGGIAQLGEHLLCKQGVSGSNPLISTKWIYGGIAQLGERLNGIQEVSGSIPLISTRN